MIEGLVQNDFQLVVPHLLQRARTVHGTAGVVTADGDERRRATYAQIGDRVDRLCAALAAQGIGQGDRVATFMWNSQEHLELYLAVPSMGAVLHTLNIRLFAEQLTYIVNHAKDRVIVVDASLIPVLAPIAATFETVERYVVVGDGFDDGDLPGEVVGYEDLLAAADPAFAYPELSERSAAALCYTSGTTGNPKGVLYSHRSTILHAMGECMSDAFGISSRDRVLPIVPMFHANAWGLPYACPLAGADLVMPGPHLQAEALTRLIAQERVTVAAAVPTIWMDVLRYVDEHASDLSSLRVVPCGGAAVPRSLMEGFQDRHGVEIIQAWGMTELSPLGALARAPRDVDGDAVWDYRASAGQIMPLVEARIVDDEDMVQSWDGVSTGELEVRGPWVASAYFEDPSGDDKFHDGWLRTGDVASIDERGYVRITDRAKDVIKSGGEWISSVELENELMGHPDVVEAAVIARPDPRWSERPVACVVPRPGAELDASALAGYLAARVARWWIPDDYVFIAEVPKTSVGKFDKKVLRSMLEAGALERRPVVGSVEGAGPAR